MRLKRPSRNSTKWEGADRSGACDRAALCRVAVLPTLGRALSPLVASLAQNAAMHHRSSTEVRHSRKAWFLDRNKRTEPSMLRRYNSAGLARCLPSSVSGASTYSAGSTYKGGDLIANR
jgi:hypothetical protein